MKHTLYLVLLLVTFSATGQVTLSSLQFEHNSASLTSANQLAINALAQTTLADQDRVISISIIGFTDTTGSNSYNMLLSEQRAHAVANYLSAQLPSSLRSKITLSWYGEGSPDITAYALHSRQRAVDVVVALQPLQVQTFDEPKEGSFIEQFGHLDQKAQQFIIPSTEPVTITGNQGTVIDIPANSFDIPTAFAGAQVTLTLKEYYALSDMVLAGFTTACGDQLLQSGGMIDVQAYVAGRQVPLKKDRTINIRFNTKRKMGNMQLFKGHRDRNGLVTWSATNTNMNATNNFEYVTLLEPYYFKKSSNNVDCPYLFCGLRNDLGLTSTKYKNKQRFERTDWPAYRAYINEMKRSFNVKTMSALHMAIHEYNRKSKEANQYVVATSELGLMNCDRFLNLPAEQRTKVLADVPTNDACSAFLAFTDLPALMPSNYFETGNVGFTNVGTARDCVLILFKKENDKLFLSMQRIKTGEQTTFAATFEEVSADEMKERMRSLDTIAY